MRDAALRCQLDKVDWGVGRAVSIAAENATLAPSAHARRFAADLRSVLGVAPAGRRVTAGWQELQPDGPGSWDHRALDRCRRALDGLLHAGWQPVLNLLHDDTPGWLHERGGWLERDTAFAFADYAAELGRRLGDQVSRWVTVADFAVPSVADRIAGMTPAGRSRTRWGSAGTETGTAPSS